MSKCFYHKNIFPNTHKHFRPARNISKKLRILGGGLQLKKINLKTKHAWIHNRWHYFRVFENKIIWWTSDVKKKKQGVSNAQFRNHIESELCNRLPLLLFCYAWRTHVLSVFQIYYFPPTQKRNKEEEKHS